MTPNGNDSHTCPYCRRGELTIKRDFIWLQVGCKTCLARGPGAYTRKQALQRWRKRRKAARRQLTSYGDSS